MTLAFNHPEATTDPLRDHHIIRARSLDEPPHYPSIQAINRDMHHKAAKGVNCITSLRQVRLAASESKAAIHLASGPCVDTTTFF
jgi:hypothetical protein